MKKTSHGFPKNSVDSIFWTYKDLSKIDTTLGIIKEVERFGHPLIFKKIYLSKATDRRYKKYSATEYKEKLKEAIVSSDINHTIISFINEEDYFNLHLKKSVNPKFPAIISIDVDSKFFMKEEFCNKFIELLKKIYLMSSPIKGFSRTLKDYGKLRDSKEIELHRKPQFHMLYWTNFFSPESVKFYRGMDEVLKAPCYRVEKLPDGGALLVLAPTPMDLESEDFTPKRNKVLSYFNMQIIDKKYLEYLKNQESQTDKINQHEEVKHGISGAEAYGKKVFYSGDKIGLNTRVEYVDQNGNKCLINMEKFVALAKKCKNRDNKKYFNEWIPEIENHTLELGVVVIDGLNRLVKEFPEEIYKILENVS